MSRRTAREISLQMLYQFEFQKENTAEQIDIYLNTLKEEKHHNDEPLKKLVQIDIDFIKEEINGVLTNFEMIDKTIEEYALDWHLDRIAKVDLTILRLAVYEILFKPDIPKEVSINEAVELAKKYSTEEAKKFVNGILGKVVEY